LRLDEALSVLRQFLENNPSEILWCFLKRDWSSRAHWSNSETVKTDMLDAIASQRFKTVVDASGDSAIKHLRGCMFFCSQDRALCDVVKIPGEG
jgi:hypothetical protein